MQNPDCQQPSRILLVAQVDLHGSSSLSPLPGTTSFSWFYLGQDALGPTELLFLPKEEGGAGVLRGFNGLGMDLNLFLMDSNTQFNKSSLSCFYKSIFNTWNLVKKTEASKLSALAAAGASLPWDYSGLSWLVGSFSDFLVSGCWGHHSWPSGGAGWTLVAGLCWSGFEWPNNSWITGEKSWVVVSSCRWTHFLQVIPNTQDAFPLIQLTSDMKDCARPHLDCYPKASLQEASGKTFYWIMVKTLNRVRLSGCTDTHWKCHFDLKGSGPAWRSLYKPPLTKRHRDLQWRILHGQFLQSWWWWNWFQGDLVVFENIWCYQNVLYWVEGDDLLFGELLGWCCVCMSIF